MKASMSSVSDRVLSSRAAGLLRLPLVALCAVGALALPACSTGETGSVTLRWTPPTENVDGSKLDDLAGYRVYWRQADGPIDEAVVIEDPLLTEFEIEDLPDGEWHAGVTAFTAEALESDLATVNFTMRQGEAVVDESTLGRIVTREEFAESAIAGISAAQ